jgi:hypothetical protein
VRRLQAVTLRQVTIVAGLMNVAGALSLGNTVRGRERAAAAAVARGALTARARAGVGEDRERRGEA